MSKPYRLEGESERTQGELLRKQFDALCGRSVEEEGFSVFCRHDVAHRDGQDFEEFARVLSERGHILGGEYVAAAFELFEQGESVGIALLVFGRERNRARLAELSLATGGGNRRGIAVAIQPRQRVEHRLAVEDVDVDLPATRFDRVEDARLVCRSQEKHHILGGLFQRLEQLVLGVGRHEVGAVYEVSLDSAERFYADGGNQVLDILHLDFFACVIDGEDVGMIVGEQLVALDAIETRALRGAENHARHQREKLLDRVVVGGHYHVGVSHAEHHVLADEVKGAAFAQSGFKDGTVHFIAPLLRRASTIL